MTVTLYITPKLVPAFKAGTRNSMSPEVRSTLSGRTILCMAA